MIKNSKISIITVVYNGITVLEKTIKSVIKQTYDNIEYIIIDGGSTDDTVGVIKKYENKVSYWVSEPDKGIYDAMNKGINLATGQWINFMNAGDIFFDIDIVEKIVPLLDDNMLVVYGGTMLDHGTYTSLRNDLDLSNMYYGQVLGHQSSFVDATYHKKNLFSLKYKIAGDYDFFLKTYVNNKTKFKRVSLVVAIFAMDGVSANNKITSALERVKSLTNVKQYNLKDQLCYYWTLLKFMVKKFTIQK